MCLCKCEKDKDGDFFFFSPSTIVGFLSSAHAGDWINLIELSHFWLLGDNFLVTSIHMIYCIPNTKITNLKWRDVFRKVRLLFLVIFSGTFCQTCQTRPYPCMCLHNTVAENNERELVLINQAREGKLRKKGATKSYLPSKIVENAGDIHMRDGALGKSLAKEPCSLLLIFWPHLHVSCLAWSEKVPF